MKLVKIKSRAGVDTNFSLQVPDHWFEKIPGGFYGSGGKKAGDPEGKESATKTSKKKDSDMKKSRSRRRYSDDEYEDDKPRRGDRDDGYRSDGHRDKGHRSDRHRRNGQGDGHTRFDGGDDGGFDEINNRPRRQRSRAGVGRRDEDDRWEYGDGNRPPFRDTNPRKPRTQQVPLHSDAAARAPGPLDRPPMGYYAAPAAMGAAATMSASSAYGSPAPVPHPSAQSTSSLRGGISTGYVPYAHIYGGPTHPQSNFSDIAPPPMSEKGSVYPSHMNQSSSPEGSRPAVKRPPAGYHQNPLAQEAPAGNQPVYLVDPYSKSRQSEEREDAYEGENERQQSRSSRSPPRRRRSRRSHSQRRSESRDVRESRDDRHSSRRERSRHDDRAKSHGRGKSVIEDNIDTSQRGLGYTAVGALAGGLLGDKLKLGNGVLSSSVGAVVGAMGANAFQARERYVDDHSRKSKNARVPPKSDPR